MSTTKSMGIVSQLSDLRNVNYLVRDFSDLKAELNNYLSVYFPDAGNDFSEASAAQALVEVIAYASDIIAFYTDRAFNEQFLSRVVERQNTFDLALDRGYQPKQISPSVANITLTFDVPVTGSTTSQFYFTIQSGGQFTSSTDNVNFQNLSPIIFNANTSQNWSSVVKVNPNNILVTEFSLTGIPVVSGTTNTASKAFQNEQGFLKIHISDTNINDILSVTDSDGNTWYQVKSLAQEYIFTGVPNQNSDSGDVPFALTVMRVPRRFVVTYNADGSADLTFGTGEIDLTSTEFMLNPSQIIFPNTTQGRFFNFNPDSISLTDFLYTTALGVSPQNTTINIQYRTGGGVTDNVGAGNINTVSKLPMQFYSLTLNALIQKFVQSSFVVTNPEPSQGGQNPETLDQIRVNAVYWYAAQDRVVSVQDYVARTASLPSAYGSVYLVVAQHTQNDTQTIVDQITNTAQNLTDARSTGIDDQTLVNQLVSLSNSLGTNSTDVKLYIISLDNNGKLAKSSSTLKTNLVTYLNQLKVMSDTLEVDDIEIINLGCRFGIHTDTTSNNPATVLLSALTVVQNYLALTNMEVGQDINVDDLLMQILNVPGVVSVPELEFTVLSGTINGNTYSTDFTGTINDLTNYNSTIIAAPNAYTIFNILVPNQDIVGRYVD